MVLVRHDQQASTRLFELLDRVPTINTAGGHTEHKLCPTVQMEGVAFKCVPDRFRSIVSVKECLLAPIVSSQRWFAPVLLALIARKSVLHV
jgi:hypothetical protein